MGNKALVLMAFLEMEYSSKQEYNTIEYNRIEYDNLDASPYTY
jgi:hypothetical protein